MANVYGFRSRAERNGVKRSVSAKILNFLKKVLTNPGWYDIIIKLFERQRERNRKSSKVQEKNKKIWKKHLTNERRCGILNKLSGEGQGSSLKIEQYTN